MLGNLPASIHYCSSVEIGPSTPSSCSRIWHLFTILVNSMGERKSPCLCLCQQCKSLTCPLPALLQPPRYAYFLCRSFCLPEASLCEGLGPFLFLHERAPQSHQRIPSQKHRLGLTCEHYKKVLSLQLTSGLEWLGRT